MNALAFSLYSLAVAIIVLRFWRGLTLSLLIVLHWIVRESAHCAMRLDQAVYTLRSKLGR